MEKIVVVYIKHQLRSVLLDTRIGYIFCGSKKHWLNWMSDEFFHEFFFSDVNFDCFPCSLFCSRADMMAFMYHHIFMSVLLPLSVYSTIKIGFKMHVLVSLYICASNSIPYQLKYYRMHGNTQTGFVVPM